MKRYGKRIADTKHSAAGSGLLAIRPMQYVMIDGHRMDVLAIDPATGAVIGRPFLTCLFDVLTRCVVGWHISMMPFSATTAMAAIKHMCSRDPSIGPGGVPETLIPDNGPDLASAAMRNLCRHVHLTISPAKKYSPNDKAHLERFFRTVNNMFSHRLPGTTFSSPSDRKDYASEKYACMTIDDVRELFEQQFLNTYHTKEHSGIKRVPILAWRDAQPSFPIPHFPLEELEVIARVPFNRTINQGRVLVEGLYYKSNALRALELRGKADVTVMLDELNLSFVYVHDPLDHKVVYRADAILGDYAKDLTMYEHKEVRARMKKLAEEDRQRLGEYAYEYARCDLWDAIQERKYEANKLKRARLKALVSDAKVKAVRVEVVDTPSIPHIAPSRAPEHPTLPGLRTWFGGDSCTNQTFEG
jgi:putative transposase